jgi:hypothetical protein
MMKLYNRLKEEIRAMIAPVLFFFFALHLVALVRVLMLQGTGITIETSASVTLAALVLGKAVLIADMLPFINRFPDKPLVYNVAWKTGIYFVVALLFHYLERLVEQWSEAGGLIAANEKLLAEIIWPHFWAMNIFLLVLILMYCVVRELIRVIGAETVRRMFFGPIDNKPVSYSEPPD